LQPSWVSAATVAFGVERSEVDLLHKLSDNPVRTKPSGHVGMMVIFRQMRKESLFEFFSERRRGVGGPKEISLDSARFDAADYDKMFPCLPTSLVSLELLHVHDLEGFASVSLPQHAVKKTTIEHPVCYVAPSEEGRGPSCL
jgi:hypothetical protein